MKAWRSSLLVLLVVGCGGEPSTIEPEPTGAATSTPTPWVAVRAPGDTSILEAPAIVRAADAAADVSASVRVRVLRLHVQPGSTVAVDEPILDVAAPELIDAAASYLGAGRGARAHGDRAAELDALREEGLASRTQVFEQRVSATELSTARDRAAATLRAAGVDPRDASSLVRRGYLTLRAPVAGVVVALNARVGEIREPGSEPLARIFGEGAARIEVRTSEARIEASAIRFVAMDGREVELSTTPLASAVDPDDGTRVSWYVPIEPTALPDGLGGTARVAAASDVFEVPVRAVAQRTGTSELVRRRDGTEARITVDVVGSSGASALVRGALAEGDEVAADIAQLGSEAP